MAGRPSAAARRGGRDEFVTVDAHELRDLIKRIKTVEDSKLKASMRKALKASADLAVEGVREAVLEPPPAAEEHRGRLRRKRKTEPKRARSTGLRRDIARATRASLLSGSDKGGGQVKVVATDSRLQPRHKGMAKAYNSRRFRHRVYGRDAWADQSGQANYFGRGVFAKRRQMLARLQAAMDDVAKQL